MCFNNDFLQDNVMEIARASEKREYYKKTSSVESLVAILNYFKGEYGIDFEYEAK